MLMLHTMLSLHALAEAWGSMDVQIQAALIGAAATLVTVGGAVLGLRHQLRVQREQADQAIAESERRKFKAAMYEDANLVTRSLSDAVIDATNALHLVAVELKHIAEANERGEAFPVPNSRFPNIYTKFAAASDAITKFVFLVESRRFIHPKILVFRSAMHSALHVSRSVMYDELLGPLMPLLPTDLPNGETMPAAPPSVALAQQIAGMVASVIDGLDDAGAYAEDFLVEMQNLLLGDLFGNKIQHRIPLDKTKKVISLDQADELEQWFQEESAWGVYCRQIEAQFKASNR